MSKVEAADAILTLIEMSKYGSIKPDVAARMMMAKIADLERTIEKLSARRDKWKNLYLEAFANKMQQEGGGT